MKIGIIGLPQCGKTTLCNALTGADLPVGKMLGGGRVAVTSATVSVPDERVDWLATLYKPAKTTHAQVTFLDIGGVQGSKSSFSGPLLNALAQTDAFLHVVRSFANDLVPHPLVSFDAARDVQALDDELLLNDLLVVERRLEKLGDERRKGAGRDKAEIEREHELFTRLHTMLNNGAALRTLQLSAEEERTLSGFGLLTRKPLLVVLNTGDDSGSGDGQIPAGVAASHRVVALQCKLEMEIAQLAPDEAVLFLAEYGLQATSLQRVILMCYDLLKRQAFFTVGEDEVRAWTINNGASAPQASGAIHSDLEAGFIRAEVMAYADLHQHGSEAAVKTAGKWRLEGREYTVQDGDILQVRFSPPSKK